MKKEFMEAAIKEAEKGMHNGDGGPFGAVVVKEGKIISTGHNLVLSTNDPTAHAEVVAIRRAAEKLETFDLSDCEIYSTCEPCPMCFAAIHWAKMKILYFGCDQSDAARIGFDDKFIYDVIKGTAKTQQVAVSQVARHQCLELFNAWEKKEDKKRY
jgi:guanine deaminase